MSEVDLDLTDDMQETFKRLGVCTFEEFRKNKEKYLGRYDDEIAAVDKGSQLLGCLNRYIIEDLNGTPYKLDAIETAERIAMDMGLSLFHDFMVAPQLRPDDRGGYYSEVTFRPKALLRKRARW